ncbi:hypothetical protein M1555_04975 [Patescibacteria group bacterium]|nr:hypothetical protein [Patescibacteria group bacterium]
MQPEANTDLAADRAQVVLTAALYLDSESFEWYPAESLRDLVNANVVIIVNENVDETVQSMDLPRLVDQGSLRTGVDLARYVRLVNRDACIIMFYDPAKSPVPVCEEAALVIAADEFNVNNIDTLTKLREVLAVL